jgi:hypothetical protein
MIFINRALKDDRVIRATIGLSASEFNQLVQRFAQEIEKEERHRYKRGIEEGNRERQPGGGRKGNLGRSTEKLFFILFYFKCYPTFDVLGLLFNLNRSNACRNVHKLTPILEKVLGKKMALPSRKIKSFEELFISSIRVQIEHAIGGIKRMQITTGKFRNKKDTFNDKAMLLSCGLWNYHLKCC